MEIVLKPVNGGLLEFTEERSFLIKAADFLLPLPPTDPHVNRIRVQLPKLACPYPPHSNPAS